jgi:uncharacterized membrane protein YdbT with pleckstrin-like domain
MAQVLGETGRHVTEQSIKKFKRQIMVIVLASFFLALVIGFLLGFSVSEQSYVWMAIAIVFIVLILVLTILLTDRVSDRLERERRDVEGSDLHS